MNKQMKLFLCLVSIMSMTISYAQSVNDGFYSERPAERWEEYLVSGNGCMGLMVAGDPYREAQVFNHTNLFMPIHEPLIPPSQGNHLKKIQEMMLAGNYQQAADFLVSTSYADGFGKKRQSDLFVPAYQLNIVSDSLPYWDYARSVDFTKGEVSVSWKNRKGSFTRRSFVSRADNVVVTEISSSNRLNLSLDISLITRFDPKRKIKFCLNDSLNIAKVEQEVTEECFAIKVWYASPWKGGYEGYQGMIRVHSEGGSLKVDSQRLLVKNAKRLLLLSEVMPVEDMRVSPESLFAKHLDQLQADYAALILPHRQIHSDLMQRVDFRLTQDDLYQDYSAEALLALGGHHPALIERLFAAARYNIISATGVNPPNLQGIWGAIMTPPWAGDYTTNGNLPTAVSHYLAASTPELMLSLFDKLESQMDHYRTNARVLFKCRGIHIPSHICLHGYDNQFDATWPMTFWTAGAAWYSMFYYDYYLYTLDKDFLRHRALPFMMEAAVFYEDFLLRGEDGKLMFNPSYSPENHPANNKSQACVNATMDMAVAKALFRDLIAASELLQVNQDKLALWKDMLSSLPDYQLNEQGELREWAWQDLQDNHEHRHASHLIGLFYRHDPEIMASEALKNGVLKSIEQRLDYRKRSKNGGVMAFGVSQLAFPACAIGQAELAYELLTMAGNNYFNNNLMTTHDPHHIFNADMSGAYPAIVLNMLAYSDKGVVSLLPACPAAWQQAEVKGVSLRGGIKIVHLVWDESKLKVVLLSSVDQDVTVLLRGEKQEVVSLKAGVETTLEYED